MSSEKVMEVSAPRVDCRTAFRRSFSMRLEGGLGNQLFQYAMGRGLSIRQNCELNLDPTVYVDNKLRPFALDVYNIKANVFTKQLGHYIKGIETQKNMPLRMMRKIGRKVLPWAFPKMVYEQARIFEPELMNLKPSAYVRGYWQTEKYFTDIRPQLLEELTVKQPLSGANLEVARQIQAGPSLSLHVRRGDYVTSELGKTLLGTCSLAYYKDALALVTSRCPNLTVFIFSDDSQWTRENICPDIKSVYVDHNDGEHGHEDIRLMSLCNHNIIANSTFSWWGAWLNRHEDKIVCCPAQWYLDNSLPNPDIYAQGWHQV